MEIYIDTKQLREYCKSLDSVFRHMQNHGGPLTSGEKSLYNAIRRYMNTAENELRKLTNRGSIAPHARFGPISEQYLEPVLQRLCEKIEKKNSRINQQRKT